MMDFKVAGNETGITTFQLDIKSEGLTLEILEEAVRILPLFWMPIK